MAEPEEQEHVSKKVIYESSTSNSSRDMAPAMIGILLVAIVLITYILLHMH